MLEKMFSVWNPGVLADGSMTELGLTIMDWIVVGFSLLLLLLYSWINEKSNFRDALSKRNVVLRWSIMYALLFFVIVMGSYGPGYSAAEFIYQAF